MNRPQPDNERLQQWWLNVLADDSVCFGKIHKHLYEGLFSYASKLLCDDDLANDAIQNLFIKVWNKRRSIGRVDNIAAYFFTALRRQILNQLRDLKLRQLKISMLSTPDIEFSQEEILVKKEEDSHLLAQLLSMLNQLPKRQKEIIYLSFFENMPAADIAEVLQINYQSVLNLKQRALQKMRSISTLQISLFSMILLLSKLF